MEFHKLDGQSQLLEDDTVEITHLSGGFRVTLAFTPGWLRDYIRGLQRLLEHAEAELDKRSAKPAPPPPVEPPSCR